jgi:hypothetical protein
MERPAAARTFSAADAFKHQGATKMRVLDFSRYALCLCVAVAMLVACGGSQPPISAPGAMPQSRAITTHAVHGGSWMAPDTKTSALIYISDYSTNDVYVYSYPQLALKGKLTGFNEVAGECANRTGDVFITNARYINIYVFAHGGKTPIRTLSDSRYEPVGCSVDRISGNLAVANFTKVGSSFGGGNVAIYEGGKGNPKAYYSDPDIAEIYACAYDNAGNLFVDGVDYGSNFQFAELPSGGKSFRAITLDQTIQIPGGVQWDGKHVAVEDQVTSIIYQFSINDAKGTKVGETPLSGASGVDQFWIQRRNVIAPEYDAGDVGIWSFPAGGVAKAKITGLKEPVGVAISLDQ